MLNLIHWAGAFALFAAMALMIVVSVSSPIWDNVGFLKGHISGQSFTLGNWGYCLMKVGGSSRTFINQITNSTNVGQTFVHGLTYALILSPICAGLSAIAFLFALGTHTVLGIIASLLSILAFVATAVSLGLDLGLFITTRNRINSLTLANTHAHLSSMIWLVVAACACQLFASFTVCFTRSRRRRAADDREFAGVPAMASTRNSMHTTHTAPASTAGSTGPLIEQPGAGGYASEPIGANATTTSGARNHFWQRDSHTEI
ncbi:SPOSA6832_02778, partial [Sporobolomyces salmonicolor]